MITGRNVTSYNFGLNFTIKRVLSCNSRRAGIVRNEHAVVQFFIRLKCSFRLFLSMSDDAFETKTNNIFNQG